MTLLKVTAHRACWGAALLCLVALLMPTAAVAQDEPSPFAEALEGNGSEGEGEEEHLETDRDSFTPATTLVGDGRTMLESSYSFIDNRDGADTHSLPELLMRFGLTNWFELRLGGNFETGGGGSVSGSELGSEEDIFSGETESNVLYGFKLAVTEQNGWVPRSAVILHATTATSGQDRPTEFIAACVAGWTLPNEWDLDTSLRYVAAKEEGDDFNEWAPSVVLKVPFAERWNAHAEYFGIFTQNRAEDTRHHFFSPGAHYLISNDIEIGVRVGWGLNEEAPKFFCNVGIGLRF